MKPAGRVRIIAGRWRGRRLPVPAVAGVRPTPERVRETLFNWLGPRLEGARCLDLFAGTGVLGLEALSRGARQATLVERDPRVVKHLQGQLQVLGCAEAARVVQADALVWLTTCDAVFDVVFVDPPFGTQLAPALLQRLRSVVTPSARVFVECSVDDPCANAPPGWTTLRERRAGRVRYYLAAPALDPGLGTGN